MPRKKTAPRKASVPAEPLVQPIVRPVYLRKRNKCVVCGSDAAPFSSEDLCWVCRRLKISAWRETEGMAAVQE